VSPTIGVLALQGGFREHVAALRALGVETLEVRTPNDLTNCAALVLPGGESTTIAMLLASSGLDERLPAYPGPILGTCAGMITLASECVDGRRGQRGLGLIDAGVRRNGYGRQARSFESSVQLSDGTSMVGVFIRAPRFDRIGPNVDVIARLGDEPVAVAQGRFIATAFHPELTDDSRIHTRFLASVEATAPQST
jgi:5'-phosphate synthase pdxT subunit